MLRVFSSPYTVIFLIIQIAHRDIGEKQQIYLWTPECRYEKHPKTGSYFHERSCAKPRQEW